MKACTHSAARPQEVCCELEPSLLVLSQAGMDIVSCRQGFGQDLRQDAGSSCMHAKLAKRPDAHIMLCITAAKAARRASASGREPASKVDSWRDPRDRPGAREGTPAGAGKDGMPVSRLSYDGPDKELADALMR